MHTPWLTAEDYRCSKLGSHLPAFFFSCQNSDEPYKSAFAIQYYRDVQDFIPASGTMHGFGRLDPSDYMHSTGVNFHEV
jgi:hypothetical protein